MNLCNTFFVLLVHCSVLQSLKVDSKSKILPTKDVCGFQRCEAFPWLVFIPLESRMKNPDLDLRCAGTLISKRHVLTHMSCFQFYLTKVHIGRYSTSKNVTCENKPILVIDVEERIVDKDSEIALLRLAEDVEFGNDVAPICLPFENFERAETGSDVYTSGWGSTSHPGKRVTKMKKVRNTLLNNKECEKADVIQDASNTTMTCIKPNGNQYDFPCDGDEGSPVMYRDQNQWILEGVLTWMFGADGEPCVTKTPARVSRITEHVLQFIIENIQG